MALVKTDDRRYARDTVSNALLSTDKAGLDRSRAHRASMKKATVLQSEVEQLREQVKHLATLVQDAIQIPRT
jgi:hypothetical protein